MMESKELKHPPLSLQLAYMKCDKSELALEKQWFIYERRLKEFEKECMEFEEIGKNFWNAFKKVDNTIKIPERQNRYDCGKDDLQLQCQKYTEKIDNTESQIKQLEVSMNEKNNESKTQNLGSLVEKLSMSAKKKRDESLKYTNKMCDGVVQTTLPYFDETENESSLASLGFDPVDLSPIIANTKSGFNGERRILESTRIHHLNQSIQTSLKSAFENSTVLSGNINGNVTTNELSHVQTCKQSKMTESSLEEGEIRDSTLVQNKNESIVEGTNNDSLIETDDTLEEGEIRTPLSKRNNKDNVTNGSLEEGEIRTPLLIKDNTEHVTNDSLEEGEIRTPKLQNNNKLTNVMTPSSISATYSPAVTSNETAIDDLITPGRLYDLITPGRLFEFKKTDIVTHTVDNEVKKELVLNNDLSHDSLPGGATITNTPDQSTESSEGNSEFINPNDTFVDMNLIKKAHEDHLDYEMDFVNPNDTNPSTPTQNQRQKLKVLHRLPPKDLSPIITIDTPVKNEISSTDEKPFETKVENDEAEALVEKQEKDENTERNENTEQNEEEEENENTKQNKEEEETEQNEKTEDEKPKQNEKTEQSRLSSASIDFHLSPAPLNDEKQDDSVVVVKSIEPDEKSVLVEESTVDVPEMSNKENEDLETVDVPPSNADGVVGDGTQDTIESETVVKKIIPSPLKKRSRKRKKLTMPKIYTERQKCLVDSKYNFRCFQTSRVVKTDVQCQTEHTKLYQVKRAVSNSNKNLSNMSMTVEKRNDSGERSIHVSVNGIVEEIETKQDGLNSSEDSEIECAECTAEISKQMNENNNTPLNEILCQNCVCKLQSRDQTILQNKTKSSRRNLEQTLLKKTLKRNAPVTIGEKNEKVKDDGKMSEISNAKKIDTVHGFTNISHHHKNKQLSTLAEIDEEQESRCKFNLRSTQKTKSKRQPGKNNMGPIEDLDTNSNAISNEMFESSTKPSSVHGRQLRKRNSNGAIVKKRTRECRVENKKSEASTDDKQNETTPDDTENTKSPVIQEVKNSLLYSLRPRQRKMPAQGKSRRKSLSRGMVVKSRRKSTKITLQRRKRVRLYKKTKQNEEEKVEEQEEEEEEVEDDCLSEEHNVTEESSKINEKKKVGRNKRNKRNNTAKVMSKEDEIISYSNEQTNQLLNNNNTNKKSRKLQDKQISDKNNGSSSKAEKKKSSPQKKTRLNTVVPGKREKINESSPKVLSIKQINKSLPQKKTRQGRKSKRNEKKPIDELFVTISNDKFVGVKTKDGDSDDEIVLNIPDEYKNVDLKSVEIDDNDGDDDDGKSDKSDDSNISDVDIPDGKSDNSDKSDNSNISDVNDNLNTINNTVINTAAATQINKTPPTRLRNARMKVSVKEESLEPSSTFATTSVRHTKQLPDGTSFVRHSYMMRVNKRNSQNVKVEVRQLSIDQNDTSLRPKPFNLKEDKVLRPKKPINDNKEEGLMKPPKQPPQKKNKHAFNVSNASRFSSTSYPPIDVSKMVGESTMSYLGRRKRFLYNNRTNRMATPDKPTLMNSTALDGVTNNRSSFGGNMSKIVPRFEESATTYNNKRLNNTGVSHGIPETLSTFLTAFKSKK